MIRCSPVGPVKTSLWRKWESSPSSGINLTESSPIMSISCVLIVQKIKCHVKLHRAKQLFRYEFLTKEEIMANPFKTLVLTDCLGMYDWALANKFFLTKGVSLDSHSGLSVKCVLTGNSLFRSHPQVYRYSKKHIFSLRFLTFLWECKQKFRLQNLRLMRCIQTWDACIFQCWLMSTWPPPLSTHGNHCVFCGSP